MESPIQYPTVVIGGRPMILKMTFQSMYRLEQLGHSPAQIGELLKSSAERPRTNVLTLAAAMLYDAISKKPVNLTPDELAAAMGDDMTEAHQQFAELSKAVAEAFVKVNPAKAPATAAGAELPTPETPIN